ncbi:MAG: hypothetical protein KDC85_08825 [Saprospiraceae bacterium]|nr:hypothetical protein [Saprospiraceae bacterium]MCB9324764.1 hypothetical protein [Lewinellaceae bacterium]
MKLFKIKIHPFSPGHEIMDFGKILGANKGGGILLGVFLLLTLSRCSPLDLPPDVTEDPVFTLSMGTDAGETIAFGGGVDGYRMFTSYQQGADGVFTFIGELKKEGVVPDTFPSIRFEIRDFLANPLSVEVEQALMSVAGFYDQTLTGESDTIYRAAFTASTGQSCSGLPSSAFTWNFDDGTFGEGYSVIHEYPNNDERTINMEINGPDGEYVSVSRNLNFGANVLPCGLQVNAFQTNTLNLTASPIGGVPPYTYDWSIGANSQTISLVIDSFLLEQQFCVTLTDATGCGSSWCGNILGGYQICNAQFSYSTSMVTDSTEAPAQFSTVTVIYRDGQGGIFRSDRQAQGMNAFFEVQEVADFQLNEFGEPTKKVKLGFSCDLFATNGSMIKINSGQGTIGVAYPE